MNPAPKIGRVGFYASREEQRTKGGPGLLIANTIRLLAARGVEADFEAMPGYPACDYGLMHFFNVWPPDDMLRRMWEQKRRGVPIVFSPIFLDLSEQAIFDRELPALFAEGLSDAALDARLLALSADCVRVRSKRSTPIEPVAGYFEKIRQMIAWSDHVIVLSECELALLTAIGARPENHTLIQNVTQGQVYRDATPDLFVEAYGVRDFVLCVGRIEGRKNQLLLLRALRDTGLSVVFVGGTNDQRYYDLLRAQANDDVLFIDRLEPDGPMLASAYAACRVFVQPSWSEGLSLSALEAAASGCAMVLSNRAAEQEYFGAAAAYCEPSDMEDIRRAVLAACEASPSPERRRALQALVAEKYDWDGNISSTLEVYGQAVAAHEPQAKRDVGGLELFYDLSQWAYHDGPPSGIARVELMLGLALAERMGASLRFVAHHREARVFLSVTREDVAHGEKSQFERDCPEALPVAFDSQSAIIVAGGRWLSDSRQTFVRDLATMQNTAGLRLITVVYDAIRYKFPEWYGERVRDTFAEQLSAFVRRSSLAIAISRSAATDFAEFCVSEHLVVPPLEVMHLGDSITAIPDDSPGSAVAESLAGKSFVLCVSGLDVRKNHKLLFAVWKRLADKHGAATPLLICVGESGVGGEEVLRFLEESALLRAHVRVQHNVEDQDLDWLYKHCVLTVYPSLYEGWGMPVKESLRYGKVCVSAKIPSAVESVPDLADLCDEEEDLWYSRIDSYLSDAELRLAREAQIKTDYAPTEWAQTAAQVEAALASVGEAWVPRIPSFPGLPLSFRAQCPSTDASAADCMVEGWYRSETEGTWTAGRRNSLALCLGGDIEGPCLLEAHISASMARQALRPIYVDIAVDGVAVGQWAVSGPGIYRAFVAPSAVANGRTRIDFDVRNPRCPARGDERQLGLCFDSLALMPCAVLAGDTTSEFLWAESHLAESGWVREDAATLWMASRESCLALPVPAEGGGFLSGGFVTQTIPNAGKLWLRLEVNGEGVADYALSSGQTLPFGVCLPDCGIAGMHLVKFSIVGPHGRAKPESKHDDGVRGIGVNLLNLSTQEAAVMPGIPNSEIRFDASGEAHRYFAGGWCVPGVVGTRMRGRAASLLIPSCTSAGTRLELRVRNFGTVRGAGLRLSVGRVEAHSWQVDETGDQILFATLPAALYADAASLLLRFELLLPEGAQSEYGEIEFVSLRIQDVEGEQHA